MRKLTVPLVLTLSLLILIPATMVIVLPADALPSEVLDQTNDPLPVYQARPALPFPDSL